jgi:putative pyruvate formate lyase activating enzyme
MSMVCSSCPRNCGIDRSNRVGFCGVSEQPRIAKAFLHMWEEPCISGTRGSGTVFFSGCNLKCVFCQNYEISQKGFGKTISIERLQEIFLELVKKGAHNINLVNPSHYTKSIKEAVLPLKEEGKLNVPIVYNTNGYETVEALKEMNGVVDVYLPDFKYFTEKTAQKYSAAANYPEICKRAILEMYSQVGVPAMDCDGIIKRGLIVRHLILPGHTKESINILDWIAQNLPEGVYISLMSQYTPYYDAIKFTEINRPITRNEYDKVVGHLFRLGLENGFIQERESSDTQYIPDFNLEGV